MKSKKIDLRTPFQLAQEKKYAAIAEAFERLREENPDASFNRICDALAKEFGMTTMGIRKVLYKVENG